MGKASLTAGVLAALTAADLEAVAESSCRPIAEVSGEAEIVHPVRVLLDGRGVVAGGAASCGRVVAALDRHERRVRVSLIDPDGRAVDRYAEDAEGAATIIESWARGDLLAPLLAARGARAASEPTGLLAAAPPAGARRIEIAAVAEAVVSDDGARWVGVRGQGCLRVAGFCFGPSLRYAKDTERRGDSAALGTGRWVLDLLLTGERGFGFGPVTVAPGIGVGQTSVHVHRVAGGPHDEDTASGLLLDGHVGASVAIGRAWSARVHLAGGYAPFTPTRFGESSDPEPPLAGLPRWQTAVGVGIGYGGL